MGSRILPSDAIARIPRLTPGETANLATLIANASDAIELYCGRLLLAQDYDQLYDDGDDAEIVLRQYPINKLYRVMRTPTGVISIANQDTSTNQRATLALAFTGTPTTTLTSTGVTLTRYASGVAIPATITWASLAPATVAALASAINALGAGWQANVAPGSINNSTSGYSLFGVADIRAPQGVVGCLGSNASTLKIHVDDAYAIEPDLASGILALNGSSPISDDTLWPNAPSSVERDGRTVRVGSGAWRVLYNAGYVLAPTDGFATIPPSLQEACVQFVRWMISGDAVDPSVRSKHLRDFSYVLNPAVAMQAMPDRVKDLLGRHRDFRGSGGD